MRLLWVITSILFASMNALSPINASSKNLRVPNQYDGSWSIVASTAEGPCSATITYQVLIKESDASVPGEDIEITGGVLAVGTVQVTIIKGSNQLPITGKLNAQGSGIGMWRTSGGLVDCNGSWTAKRTRAVSI